MKHFFTLLFCCSLTALPLKAQLIAFDTLQTSTVTDVDGNVYKTIRFGDTWWMAENLKTKHFNDGTVILQMTKFMSETDTQNDWGYWAGVERWGYPALDPTNFDTYGLLYSWFAAADTKHGGLCPEGWVLTDTSDWFNLGRLIVDSTNFVWESGTRNTPDGGTETYYEISQINNIGRYLKTDNGALWTYQPGISSKCGAAGMNVVPTGKLNTSNYNFKLLADYWTGCYVHSDSDGQGRRYLHFGNNFHGMQLGWNHNANLQCVRCVKAAGNTTTRVVSTLASSVTIYPNPAQEYVFITGDDNASYSIFSQMGQLVKSGQLSSSNQQVAISELKQGIYFLSIRRKNGTQRRFKLIKK
jgi:uncharacterized protein (TIGR02145 family)